MKVLLCECVILRAGFTGDLDVFFAGGYTGLSAALNRAALFHSRNLAEALSAAEALARRAVALDGGDAEARARLAIALNSRRDC